MAIFLELSCPDLIYLPIVLFLHHLNVSTACLMNRKTNTEFYRPILLQSNTSSDLLWQA